MNFENTSTTNSVGNKLQSFYNSLSQAISKKAKLYAGIATISLLPFAIQAVDERTNENLRTALTSLMSVSLGYGAYRLMNHIARENEKKCQEEQRATIEEMLDDLFLHASLKEVQPGNQHTYVFANDQQRQLMSKAQRASEVFSLEDIVGRTAADFFPPEIATQILTEEQYVLATGQNHVLYQKISFGGAEHHLHDLKKKIQIGDKTYIFTIGADLTQLNSLLKKYKNESTELNFYLGAMAHELKNSLNGVSMLLQCLQEAKNDPHSLMRLNNLFEPVGQLVGEMADRINTLTQLARAGSGEIQIESAPYQIADLATYIEQKFEQYKRQNAVDENSSINKITLNIAVQTGQEQTVVTDRTCLNEIVENLLTNAIKHARNTVSVTIAHSEEKNEYTKISIWDDGTGIKPERIKQVFSLYQTTQPLNGRQIPVGIGLAISQRLCDVIGGTINAESDGESYTRMTLAIPTKKYS